MNSLFFAFDLGKCSIGDAVRQGSDIIHAESLLIDEDRASIKNARERRRAMRTRISHKHREMWLEKVCSEAGIEVLQSRKVEKNKTIPGDPRLEREFPSKNDSTCYTSCLLRIKLLRGEKLESWQIYKALRSAIQHRGYDKNLPWAKKENKKSKKEETEMEEKISIVKKQFAELEKFSKDYLYPCYREAWLMGLFDPKTGEIKERIDNNASRARDAVYTRQMVEKELRALIEQASKTFPALSNKADYILYGPAEKPYASFYPDISRNLNLKRGSQSDLQGVLSQKVPRFDNRVVRKCALIPRFNACKADDGLVWQLTFLMKLKNLRYWDGKSIKKLTNTELKDFLEAAIEKAKQIEADKRNEAFALTHSQWKQWCKKHGGTPFTSDDKVDAPKKDGRSRFSRSALRLLKELLLSGLSPHKFYEEKLKTTLPDGLKPEDINFLKKMPDDWEKIHIPDNTTESLIDTSNNSEEAVKKLIGEQIDPIVRHRLELFSKRLDDLQKKFGIPEKVVIEFVREDFMGEKTKAKLISFQKDREKERKNAKDKLEKIGIPVTKQNILKLQLLEQQGGICLYTGVGLEPSRLDEYELEHIVPRTMGGPDSIFNLVLTTKDANKEKDKKTPFEWLSSSGHWEAFKNRVDSHKKTLGKKKVKLLLSDDAVSLAEKYTALAETAWISKLAQKIVYLKFNWELPEKGGQKKVIVVPGGFTAKIRRNYGLNKLLWNEETTEEELEKKCRDDDRHHALDAMVLSFIPAWAENPDKRKWFSFPDKIEKDPYSYFKSKIEQVIPCYLCPEKASLEETYYAKRIIQNEESAVTRFSCELENFPKDSKGNFDIKKGINRAYTIIDDKIKEKVIEFLSKTPPPTKEEWINFVKNFRTKTIKGQGSPVKKVACKVGSLDEFKDFSKDCSGQFKKGKAHKGYFVCIDAKGKPFREPVYVFESKFQVKKRLREKNIKIIDFFYTGCLVEIEKDIQISGKKGNARKIPKGRYILSTIMHNNYASLKGNLPELKNPISLDDLLKAGFKIVK